MSEKKQERLFCAFCGEWGNHQSGSCVELLLNKVYILEHKIKELEQKLSLRAERENDNLPKN